jgi:putative DNA primase/helicase
VYATLVQREDYPEALKKTLMHRWLLSAVAAALKPNGFRTRGVLTLQGPQSLGKTAWVRSLVSDLALCQQVIKLDHHMDPHNKDSLLTAIANWLVEIGELDGSLKKDVAKFKGFLTSDQDKVRRPYAKVDSEYPRRTVFVATVNQEDFLVDSTGNTRFWTIAVVFINYDHGIDMQQVFAQLALEYKRGEQWWLTKEEEAWLEEHNKDHRAVSPVREQLLERLDLDRRDAGDLQAMTANQVLRAIGFKDPTIPQCRECGTVLREFLGDPKKNGGLMKWRVPLAITEFNL